MDTFARASTKARIIFAVLVVLMIVAIFFSGRFFDRAGNWIAEDPSQSPDRFDIFIAWVAFFPLPFLIANVATCRSGSRSVRSERFPSDGSWLIFDTPVETGARAKARGRLLQPGGILMSVLAAGLPVVLWCIVHSVAAAA